MMKDLLASHIYENLLMILRYIKRIYVPVFLNIMRILFLSIIFHTYIKNFYILLIYVIFMYLMFFSSWPLSQTINWSLTMTEWHYNIIMYVSVQHFVTLSKIWSLLYWSQLHSSLYINLFMYDISIICKFCLFSAYFLHN